MPNPASRLLLCAFGLLFLYACGQRGPLYLPENPPPNQGKSLCPTCSPVAEEKPEGKAKGQAEQDNTEGSTNQANTDSSPEAADADRAEADNNTEQPEASPLETSETMPNENNE